VHQRHRCGRRAERAQADEEDAPVLLPDDDVPALRQRQAEAPRAAVPDGDDGAGVACGEVVEERRR
jgi:hypothetical protein